MRGYQDFVERRRWSMNGNSLGVTVGEENKRLAAGEAQQNIVRAVAVCCSEAVSWVETGGHVQNASATSCASQTISDKFAVLRTAKNRLSENRPIVEECGPRRRFRCPPLRWIDRVEDNTRVVRDGFKSGGWEVVEQPENSGNQSANDEKRNGYVKLSFHRMREEAPNDPKLSDSRSWRAGCVAGERRRQEAASMTAERVRCSAWLDEAASRE